MKRQLDDGIDYVAGKITVIDLLERYISLKQGVRCNTEVGCHIPALHFGYDEISQTNIYITRNGYSIW